MNRRTFKRRIKTLRKLYAELDDLEVDFTDEGAKLRLQKASAHAKATTSLLIDAFTLQGINK
jgi:hypothetical protein